MAFSLNKIMLIGNLGMDAEERFTTSNMSVIKFSIATSHRYKGKDGNWTDETTWHNVVAFNLPDYFKESLKKGRKFYVEGRLSKREYTDKDGNKRYFTEVISEKLIPLDSRDTYGEDSAFTPEKTEDRPVADNTPEDDDLPF